jgi:hypothetical protein
LTAANLAKSQKLAGIRKDAHEAVKKADRFGFAPRRDPECGNAQEFLETGGAMSGDLESRQVRGSIRAIAAAQSDRLSRARLNPE